MEHLLNAVKFYGKEKLKNFFKLTDYGTHLSVEIRYKKEPDPEYPEKIRQDLNKLLINFLNENENKRKEVCGYSSKTCMFRSIDNECECKDFCEYKKQTEL